MAWQCAAGAASAVVAHPAHRLHSQLNYSALREQYAVAGREPIALNSDDAKARGLTTAISFGSGTRAGRCWQAPW